MSTGQRSARWVKASSDTTEAAWSLILWKDLDEGTRPLCESRIPTRLSTSTQRRPKIVLSGARESTLGDKAINQKRGIHFRKTTRPDFFGVSPTRPSGDLSKALRKMYLNTRVSPRSFG